MQGKAQRVVCDLPVDLSFQAIRLADRLEGRKVEPMVRGSHIGRSMCYYERACVNVLRGIAEGHECSNIRSEQRPKLFLFTIVENPHWTPHEKSHMDLSRIHIN